MKIYLSLILCLGVCLPVAANPRGERFEALDQNRDGRITLLEMQYLSRERFKKADANGDGQINTEEVLNLMPFFVRGQAREPVARYLKRQDQNGDGKVSLAEVQAHARQRFNQLDQNRDGALSPEEFARNSGKMEF